MQKNQNSINERVRLLLRDNTELRDNFNALLVVMWKEDYHTLWQNDMSKHPSSIWGFTNAIRDNLLTNEFTIRRCWEVLQLNPLYRGNEYYKRCHVKVKDNQFEII